MKNCRGKVGAVLFDLGRVGFGLVMTRDDQGVGFGWDNVVSVKVNFELVRGV